VSVEDAFIGPLLNLVPEKCHALGLVTSLIKYLNS